jgi:hypothetical protein
MPPADALVLNASPDVSDAMPDERIDLAKGDRRSSPLVAPQHLHWLDP